MDFVAAAANLRCHVFHMSLSTRFKIKSMAGNVIPAIATTNAIIASMIVLQAMKVLDGKREVRNCERNINRIFITLSIGLTTAFHN